VTQNTLLLYVILLQTALIYYHHFSPFERESNLRAVLWGARPAPRYWAVVALDACAGLLLLLLALGLWPQSPGDAPLARLVRTLPAGALAALLAAGAHHAVNDAVIRFPNLGLMARRAVPALIAGAGAVAAALLAVALAAAPDWNAALALWLRLLWPFFIPACLLALAVFLLRALAFFLRVLPVVGSLAHAAASTLLLVGALAVYGWLAGSVSPGAVWPGLAGLEGVALGLGALALVALLLAWRLPGPARGPDAADPPPLVVGRPTGVRPNIAVTEAGATMSTAQVRVAVTRAPFGLTVTNAQGETLCQLAPKGLTRDVLLFKIVSIPLLYTGNTMKLKWRAWSRPLSPVTSIEADGDALRVTLGAATLRLSFHAEDVLHLTVHPSPSQGDPLKGAGGPGVRVRMKTLNALSLALVAPADAHYLGFGQRFNKFDQRGEETYLLVEEGGFGYGPLAPILKHVFGARGTFPNGEQCTGFPVPFFLTSRESGATVGLFWNTYRPSWASIARRGVTRLTVLDDSLDLYLCAGPTALDAIRQYTDLTGRSDPPPPWSLLPWKTRTGPVTEDDTREDLRRFRELGIPLAHVGIEHWQEVRGSYEFSRQWYPHIDDLIAESRAAGCRITVWHFPYMNAGSAAHREGVRRGYFLRNRLGLPYQQRIFHGIATVIDYTNPHAAAWHQAIVKKAFYERGFQGAMTDYAESVPPDCVGYNGQPGLAIRNAYPVLYVQAMQRAAQDVLGDDHIIYPRAGYAGSQRFITLQWPGDQDTDWDDGDGLPAAVRAMLNASLCGFPVHGSDIGGWCDWYTPATTRELFLRWAEVGTYSPLMRAHGGPIYRNREPWKFDGETVDIYRALSEEHVRLFPYLYSLACEASRTGAPLVRHPVLLWPHVSELYEIEDAWLLGDALYVAPVVRPGQTQREVLLPPGEWWSLSEGRPVRGPARIVVDAPLGQTPRFLRRGHILPRFARAFDTFDETPTARVGRLDDELEVWLYPAEGVSSFTLFDGTELRAEAHGDQVSVASGPRRATWHIYKT